MIRTEPSMRQLMARAYFLTRPRPRQICIRNQKLYCVLPRKLNYPVQTARGGK